MLQKCTPDFSPITNQQKSGYTVLLTDLDNTLYDFVYAMEQACQAVITMTGAGDSDDLINACIFSPHGVENPQTIRDFLHAHEISDELLIASVCEEFERVKNVNIIPFPGVVKYMNLIHAAGIKIGAVTNASSGYALQRLDLIGISTIIDLVISPDTTGRKKPDPEIFRITAEKIKAQPNQICVLGDNLINDIAPAQQAGMYGVHARYGDRLPVEYTRDIKPDAIIDSFDQIITVLGLVRN